MAGQKRLMFFVYASLFFLSILAPSLLTVPVQAVIPAASVNPSSLTVELEQNFNVDIAISDVLDLYGWEFVLSWDPYVLDAVNVVEGPFLKGDGRSTFFTYSISLIEGRIVVDCTLLGWISGVSGSGILSTLTFYPKNSGECSLDLYDFSLIDSDEQPIFCQASDGYVRVNSSLYDPWKSSFIELDGYPIVDFAVYDGSLYAAADSKLYAYDGSSWNVVDAPAFVTSLESYGDKLVVGGQGGLYCYDGTSFSQIFSVPTYIKVLGLYNNTLYAGTMLDNPPKLYYCDGSADNPADWRIDTSFSAILNFSGAFGSIDSFAEYNGALYLTSGGTVYRLNETGWSTIKTYVDVFGFSSMKVYNGKLYLATRDQGWRKPLYHGGTGFSGRVIEYDGENWTTVLDHDYWVYSLEVYDDKLYAGTANKILMYNGTSWETSFNATEGAYYAISMITYDGKVYAGMGNGHIFVDPAPPKPNLEVTAVPEFPSATILAVFMALTIPAVVLIKRKRPKRLNWTTNPSFFFQNR